MMNISKRKLAIGGSTIAAIIAGGLLLHHCSTKPVVYSPRILNRQGYEMNVKEPLPSGGYIAVPREGKYVDKVTTDIKGDGKAPTEKSLPFVMKEGQKMDVDTKGYNKGKQVASDKLMLHGKILPEKPQKKVEQPKVHTPPKAEEIPKVVEAPKIAEVPKIIEVPKEYTTKETPKEEIIKPKEEIIKPKEEPKGFDLKKDSATIYKIEIADNKYGWLLNFSDTKAHSKNGKEGLVEYLETADRSKETRVENTYFIAVDPEKDKLLWTNIKSETDLTSRAQVNGWTSKLLNQGYVIKGQNQDGLFLFDKESIEKYNIQVKLNQKGPWPERRLCDIITWETYDMSNVSGGSGGGGGGSGSGSGGGGGGGK